MRISRVLILFVAVIAGLYWVPRLFVGGSGGGGGEDSFMQNQAERAKQVLAQEVTGYDLGCMRDTFTLPYSTRENKDRRCDRCEDLYEAGLVTKTVEEYQEYDQTAYDTRFELTELGASVYQERVNEKSNYRYGKICFGTAVLHHIDEMLSPVKFGDQTMFGVTYTMELRDPHPFIFDPRSQALKVEAPKAGTPALYPPRITTVAVHPGGGQIEDDFRYGKYLNK